MNKKNLSKNKLIFISSIGILALSIPFTTNILSKSELSNISYTNSNLNQNTSISSRAAGSSNFDYIPIANNVNAEPVSTNVGFLGINSDNNTLYLTSYEGVTVWQTKVNDQPMVKQYYSNNLKINDISGYTIKSWKYLKNSDIIAIILSDSNGSNATVFGIKADTGLIHAPILDSKGNPKPNSNMVQVNDGSNVLWENSKGQVVVTIFGDYSVYSSKTFLISFSKTGVSKFIASVRNIAVNPDNALNKQNQLNNTSVTIGNTSVRYTSKTGWDKGDGSRWYLQALIKGADNSGTNIAIFSDTKASMTVREGNNSTNYDVNFQQVVLVDDNLNPILNSSNQKIVLTLNKVLRLSSIWDSIPKLPKYGYSGSINGTTQNFIWVTSGVWNAATQIAYNSSSKTLTESKVFDLQWQSDQDVYTYSYDATENRLFTSNSYTSSQAAIGYIDFDDSTLQYKGMIQAAASGDIAVTNILKFSPVVSDQSISQTPIVYFDPNDNSKIKGLYFQNSTTTKNVDLLRKTYQNIQTKAQTLPWYKTKSASTVTNDEALNALVYDGNPLNGTFTNSVETLKGNDNNGTLNVRYKTAYQNWWDTSKSSNFYVETTITGMYAMDESSFNFVTVNNGNSENDNMLKSQNTFKEKTYPSSVKWSDISTYFSLAKIKDFNGNVISLTKDMITLEPNNAKGTLKITADYSSKLPTGLPKEFLVYENEFSGFLNLEGYDFHMLTDDEQNASEKVKEIRENLYPSELTVSQFLDNYMELGSSYSKNINDWDFTVVPNDYDGFLNVSLTYNPKSNPLPKDFPSENKEIVKNVKISGFKSIINDFRNITTRKYIGIKNANDIWNEYKKILDSGQNNFISTSLAGLISVPYIDNFADLDIQRTNSETDDILELSVSIKPNTVTRLLINRKNFTFDSSTAANFESHGLEYPYKVKINVETIEQAFLWKKPNGETINYTNNEAETIKINLSDYQYKSINSDMYADDVTEQDIKNLFEAIGFINIKINLQKNNQDGIVYATVSLNSTDNFNVEQNLSTSKTKLQSANYDSNSLQVKTNTIPDGSVFVKRFEITGFKKPFSPVITTISSSIAAVIILFLIIFVVYLKVIHKNLHKVIINKEDKKFVKKMELKNQVNKNKIIKKNKKNLIKKQILNRD